MGVFRRNRESKGEALEPAAPVSSVTPEADAIPASFRAIELEARIDARSNGGLEESDVFVRRRAVEASSETVSAEGAALQGVTLFVYGWENVQPGPLSWVFPSLRAALAAVQTMKNAVAWCICSGSAWASVDIARAEGAVLVEQTV